MENLFDNPTTLRDPKYLVGREDTLVRTFALLANMQSVSLVGPRRIGKTSVLTCLRDAATQQDYGFDGSRYLFLYLDLQKQAPKTDRANFLDYLYQALREQGLKLGRAVDAGVDLPDQFDALLDELNAIDLRPVIMLDAFDEIKKYQQIDESVFGFLRSLAGEGKITFITASMDILFRIFQQFLPEHLEVSSPFFNIFAIIRLSRLAELEAQKLLTETSAEGGVPFSPGEVAWVIRQAGTHPYLLQQVAAQLFEARRSQSREPLAYGSIQKGVQLNLFSHFEDSWKMLPPKDRQELLTMISALAEGDTPKKDDSHACPEFHGSQLFYHYLRTRHPRKSLETLSLSKLSTGDLKRILSFLNNLEQLGQSILVNVPCIAARIERQGAIGTTVRGKIVKETLAEALEHLRGQGDRSDGAPDWNAYNILYYRFFMLRHDMNQNMIASRLSISERQYYRFFPKALERFKNALIAIDANEALKNSSD